MEDLNDLHGRDLIEAVHPLGELDRDHMIHAAQEMRELVRWMNHATCDRAGREAALPYPSSLDSVAWSLQLALESMPQLMRQLRMRLAEYRKMARFATDDGDQAKARQRAMAAETQLSGIEVAMEGLARNMYEVCRETTHLKFD